MEVLLNLVRHTDVVIQPSQVQMQRCHYLIASQTPNMEFMDSQNTIQLNKRT